MNEERIIELITGFFDSKEEFHEVYSLKDVESVFREVEKFCQDNDIHFEHEVETEDFEEIADSPEPDVEREEVKFELPIIGHDLVLEFFYYKTGGVYKPYVDVDYYFDYLEESIDKDDFEF